MATMPEWVTTELFEKALREFFEDESIHILGYTSTAAVAKGENYTSDLYRTSITYRNGQQSDNKNISIIVKCSPQNEVMLNLVREMGMFEKEIELFTKTLPALNKLLGDLGPLTSKCLYSINDVHKLIMFEDLATPGFKTLDRREGLDLEHSLLTVEKIAQFHAASLVLLEKDPTLVSKYTEGIFAEVESIAQWIESGFNSLIKVCSKWPGFERYANKLRVLGDKIITKGMNSSKPKLGSFKVLNHGDAWVNNFMFSYAPDGKLQDFRFVDFQLIIHSSPVLDLHFFWATSPALEIRRQYLDTILDHYYSSLLATLTKMQYCLERVPTRRQLRKEFNSRAFYGLMVSIVNLPLIKAPPQKNASFDDLMANDDEQGFRYECYNNEIYKKHMEFLLPFYDKLGALDFY